MCRITQQEKRLVKGNFNLQINKHFWIHSDKAGPKCTWNDFSVYSALNEKRFHILHRPRASFSWSMPRRACLHTVVCEFNTTKQWALCKVQSSKDLMLWWLQHCDQPTSFLCSVQIQCSRKAQKVLFLKQLHGVKLTAQFEIHTNRRRLKYRKAFFPAKPAQPQGKEW